jgi:hypothetical protein
LRQLLAAQLQERSAAPVTLYTERPEQRDYIKRLATLVALGRTAVHLQKVRDPETTKEWYEAEIGQQEGPFRVQQQLRNLARGLARFHGRSCVTGHELELVRRVAVGSLPADRADVIALLPQHPRGLTETLCARGIRKSETRARQLLRELVRIGLLETTTADTNSGGRPASLYVPVPRFADLLTAPLARLDHPLDIAQSAEGDFPHKTYTPGTDKDLERGRLSGTSCVESPGTA